MAFNDWSGFSEEDLRKIEQENYNLDNNEMKDLSSKKTKEATRLSLKEKSTIKNYIYKSTAQNMDEEIPNIVTDLSSEVHINNGVILRQNEKLKIEDASSALKSNKSVVTLRVKNDGQSFEVVDDAEKRQTAAENLQELTCDEKSNVISDEDSSHLTFENKLPTKKMTLEEFQWRQKFMEEQNSKRRALLTKALSDRRKKTVAETEKLAYIQNELEKLNSLVTSDIAILRKQIEIASIEFSEVQKRYEKAEKEFVQTKLELFRKMERKEQLTEHLCTIIEQNELRKAKKLAKLMYELEMESLVEQTSELNMDEPVLPQLRLLGESNHVINTIGNPSKICLEIQNKVATPVVNVNENYSEVQKEGKD